MKWVGVFARSPLSQLPLTTLLSPYQCLTPLLVPCCQPATPVLLQREGVAGGLGGAKD